MWVKYTPMFERDPQIREIKKISTTSDGYLQLYPIKPFKPITIHWYDLWEIADKLSDIEPLPKVKNKKWQERSC